MSHLVANGADESEDAWRAVLEKAILAIVSVKYYRPRNFDTWACGSFTATGFVVSVEHSLIVTNKHVTSDGPFIGKVVFKNSEEAPAHVVWVDPIHDYAILRFDSTKLKFMTLEELHLAPERARVGVAVRIPGNDAGERMAVLSGIIARVDRPAPSYGLGKYYDFNTYYIQASANTSGGSSGSPVIDIKGNAVALNAGGSVHAASSFFFPLERVKRAVEFIIAGKTITRGTLQVEFSQRGFDECRRLGLPSDMEKDFRDKDTNLHGLLAVKTIVPQGPASGKLKTGDLLLKMNGVMVNHFVEIAEILDSSVGGTVSVVVFRNKTVLELTDLPVNDLFSLIPTSFLEIGDAIVHSLSFNLAKQYLHPLSAGGPVFIADPGDLFGVAGLPHYCIITAVNHKPTPTIEEFVKVTKTLQQGERIPVRYYPLSKKNVDQVRIVLWETKWSRYRCASRDVSTGVWSYNLIEYEKVDLAPQPFTGGFLLFQEDKNTHQKLAAATVSSLCIVRSHTTFGTDGYNGRLASGVGIIVDASIGLVVADRHTVPTSAVTLFCNFANNITVPARLLYFHPFFSLAWLLYDTSFVSNLPLTSITMPQTTPIVGDDIYYATLNTNTQIPRVQATRIKATGHFYFHDSNPPRYRVMNWDDAIQLEFSPDVAGVLVDKSGTAHGIWLSSPDGKSHLGMNLGRRSHARLVSDALIKVCGANQYKLGIPEEMPSILAVDVEFSEVYISKARRLGLADDWIARICSERKSSLQFGDPTPDAASAPLDSARGDAYSIVTVRRVRASEGDEEFEHPLVEGDLVLSVDGEVAFNVRDQLMKVLEYDQIPTAPSVASLRVLRYGEEKDVDMPWTLLSGIPQNRYAHWAGLIVQPAHRALFFHVKRLPKGIFIPLLRHGSPAQKDGVSACWFITEVDGVKTPDIESFLRVVEGENWRSTVSIIDPVTKEWTEPETSVASSEQVYGYQNSRSFRLTVESLEHVVKVLMVETCEMSRVFWPTWMMMALEQGISV
ncbi:hypothetical protein DFJ73DRAFT_492351 [Zopfochytrium polystomum]|nr:hypothetical protein DFJ73DRAFT_492351 [Zopfochytrium polystomum]